MPLLRVRVPGTPPSPGARNRAMMAVRIQVEGASLLVVCYLSLASRIQVLLPLFAPLDVGHDDDVPQKRGEG